MNSSLQLLTLCKGGKGHITKWSPYVERMNNGIEYYIVEVTYMDGIQYGIQAFGEEAITLHEETMKMIQENQEIVSTDVYHDIQ